MWRMGFGTLHYVLVPVKVDLGWRLRTMVLKARAMPLRISLEPHIQELMKTLVSGGYAADMHERNEFRYGFLPHQLLVEHYHRGIEVDASQRRPPVILPPFPLLPPPHARLVHQELA